MNKPICKVVFISMSIMAFSGCGGQSPAATSASVPPTESAGETTAAESPEPADTPQTSDGGIVEDVAGRIVWLQSSNPYGHTGFKLESGGMVIYLDPVELTGLDSLPKADVILITHPHEDHFSVPTIAALTKEGTVVASIRQVGDSLDGVDFVPMAVGDTADVVGLEVTAVAAYNSYHPKDQGWLGFVFSVEGVRIYCTGDTDWIPEMESIIGIDIAVVNLRSPYSLSGRDAVRVAETIKPKIVIPVHWMPDDDTYGDLAELEYLRENIPAGVRLMVLEPMP
jgi:L-ascorbate metabolism protein UlaG (beta-lactamase superfamily)